MNRQASLRAIEGLNLAFFIDAQHQRMFGRVQIQPDDVDDFLGKLRIVRDLERLGAMRLQAIRLPHAMHHAARNLQMLRQRPRAPMGSGMRLLGRRDAHNLRRSISALR